MLIHRSFAFSSFVLMIVLGVAACRPGIAWAGVGFQPVSPDELKMTSEPLAPGAPAIILFRQVERDDNGKTSHEGNYFRIKILNEEGRKYANVEIPFFKENEDVVSVHGRTIRPDGSIANFDGKVFEKNLVRGRGVKVLAKTFTLPDVQVGGIIEYFYTVDLEQHTLDLMQYHIYNSNWILSEELFTRKAQFSLKPYTSRPGARFPALELAGTASRRRGERGVRQHRPDGSKQYTGVPDGRLHASSERIEVAGGFCL